MVRLPVWQGKQSPSMDAAEANFMRRLLGSPPVGAAIQVFVGNFDNGNIVQPCTGGYGVDGRPQDVGHHVSDPIEQ